MSLISQRLLTSNLEKICIVLKDTAPIRLSDGKSISQNVASLNTLAHDCL